MTPITNPALVITVGAFGRATGDVLAKLMPGVAARSAEDPAMASPTHWPKAGMIVLIAWRPAPRWFDLVDDICHAYRIPFIPVVQESPKVRIGPIVVPHQSACYHCFEQRLAQHAQRAEVHIAVRQYYDNHQSAGPAGFIGPIVDLMAVHLARLMTRVTSDATAVAGRWESFNMITRQVSTGTAVGVNNCPRCGRNRNVSQASYADLRQALQGLFTRREENLSVPADGVPA